LQENPLAPPIGRFPPELKKAADPASVPPFDPNLFQLDAAPQQGLPEKGAIIVHPVGWNVFAPEQCDHALHWILKTLSSPVRASFMIRGGRLARRLRKCRGKRIESSSTSMMFPLMSRLAQDTLGQAYLVFFLSR
jgi:hypothetical protein